MGAAIQKEIGRDSQNNSKRGSWDNSGVYCAGVNYSTLEQAKSLWERVPWEETLPDITG